MSSCGVFTQLVNNKIINHMDTLATIYDKMHVNRVQLCYSPSGGSASRVQIPYFRDTLGCPLFQQVLHLPVITAHS